MSDKNIVSLIIPCCNQVKFTKMCLASIQSCTRHPYELIMVDNGSTDDTNEWLIRNELKKKIILNIKNVGAPAAFNQGIKNSRGDFVLLLNNDTIVTDGWMSRLVNWAESDKNIGIVGACSNSFRDRAGLFPGVEGYRNIPEIQKTAVAIYLANRGKYEDVPGLTSFCMLVKREVIDKVGGFDECYGLGTNDDHDFCFRVKKAGYRIICALDTFVFHFYNRTLINFDIEELDRKNREYFVKKFGKQGIEYLNLIGQPYGSGRAKEN